MTQRIAQTFRPRRRRPERAVALAMAVLVLGFASAGGGHSRGEGRGAARAAADYCAIESPGTAVEIVRPGPAEAAVDDVNWFARPVPNPQGRRIVAFASHNANYLYDLSGQRRVRIPDRADAVATPDGRFMTVPSHYTDTHTINFYDLPTLLQRLARGQPALDVPPVFAHSDEDVYDVFYQSVGLLSYERAADTETIVYRMMFSGSRKPAPPGFRIVDYTFTRRGGTVQVRPSRAMRLCPEIVNDMATPFISKDGRYVAAHEGAADGRPSLKIFEITGVQPAAQTTSCRQVVDFGFVAGKADFSYDNSALTFHIAVHDYLTAFIDGGLAAPIMTDVVVADLKQDASGAIVGYGGMTRITTTTTPGVGNYFPAFFPDGRLFYLSNLSPKNSDVAKRFTFTVVDPSRDPRYANIQARADLREPAAAIGNLWRTACAPDAKPLEPDEAAWLFTSLSRPTCRGLVEGRAGPGTDVKALLAACDRLRDAATSQSKP